MKWFFALLLVLCAMPVMAADPDPSLPGVLDALLAVKPAPPDDPDLSANIAAERIESAIDQADLPKALQMTPAVKAAVERLAAVSANEDARPDEFTAAFVELLRVSMADAIPAEGLDLPAGLSIEVPWDASGTIAMPGLLPGVTRQEPICGKGVLRLKPRFRLERPLPRPQGPGTAG